MEIKLTPKIKYIRLDYDWGHTLELLDEKKENIDTIRISHTRKVVKSKVFSIRNILKYYWWHLKQRLFWKHPKSRRFLKNLNDTPYL